MTGTISCSIMIHEVMVRDPTGIPEPSIPLEPKTIRDWISILSESWFSRKLSSGAKMRGSANKNAVLRSIRKNPGCDVSLRLE